MGLGCLPLRAAIDVGSSRTGQQFGGAQDWGLRLLDQTGAPLLRSTGPGASCAKKNAAEAGDNARGAAYIGAVESGV